jgi:hypothetical protein
VAEIKERVQDTGALAALGRAIEATSVALAAAGDVVGDADAQSQACERAVYESYVAERVKAGEETGQGVRGEEAAVEARLARPLARVHGRYEPLVGEAVGATLSCVTHLLATGAKAGLVYPPPPAHGPAPSRRELRRWEAPLVGPGLAAIDVVRAAERAAQR